ncbi:hypothetical protein EJF36_10420 [Bacillus sp. HMF5848]|uniref:DUF7010 family protein n=1 Tax=Bacillus sp. HMF5848 TaxID=2495421 RepID=UPI000F78F28C|nr:hypothetical protein [Bacillus sp. HMF5848]RSK27260.1 hypothetical protein EJF36_10420 [Bacillus sp. HMF5848]
MNMTALRNDLSVRSKNGIPFISSAFVVWSIFLIIYLSPTSLALKNIMTFYCTGIMFPIAILFAKFTKSEWKSNDNPIGILGLYINLAQLMYFPMIFWMFANSPTHMLVFFAIITGAHLFPYGWFYNTNVYTIMAPVMAIGISIVGWKITEASLWLIPISMMVMLTFLIIFLYLDYKRKVLIYAPLEGDKPSIIQ